MRKSKKQKIRSKPATTDGSTTSLVEEEVIRPPQCGQSGYERERQLRIEENRARMEALGLSKIAASLAPTRPDEVGDKGVANWRNCEKEEDEDYNPNLDRADEDADDLSSSSEGFVDDDDDEDYATARCSSKNKSSRVKKKVPVVKQKLGDSLDFLDEDEALKKAIAFSLQDYTEGCSASNASPRKAPSPQLTGKKKGRKSATNRVQMNEDDVVIHFCQLDEAGKGNITGRDLEKIALSHDFIWTEKELLDMIRCFDRDGDGKLTMEDFRHIVVKCNLLQTSEDT